MGYFMARRTSCSRVSPTEKEMNNLFEKLYLKINIDWKSHCIWKTDHRQQDQRHLGMLRKLLLPSFGCLIQILGLQTPRWCESWVVGLPAFLWET